MRYALICDGILWTGWRSFSVRQTMESATHSFSFTTTDRLQEGLERWNVKGGSLIEFFIDDHRIVAGYVRKYSPTISADRHEITIEGESAAVDLVDCSHLGPYFWPAGPAQRVVDDVLRPFGVTLTINTPLTAIPAEGYRVGVNDTPFEIVRKLLERDRLTLYTDRDNNLVATDGRNPTDAGDISRGDYIEIGADHDLSNSFSEIVVRAQKNDQGADDRASFNASQRQERRVVNPAETRYRPVVFLNSGEPEAQREFADDLNRRFAGDVITARAVVKSHLNKRGNVWGANQLVLLNEPLIDARQRLVTSEVEMSLDESSGFRVNLTLKLPAAFDREGGTAREARLAPAGPFQDVLAGIVESVEREYNGGTANLD